MALIEFKNLPDTTTAITAENLNYNFSEILNLVCPIGKVEVFFDNNDHSNYLGFTWERTSIGRVPVGIDTNDTDFDTIGETGGEKKHTLTALEMPSHYHSQYIKDFLGQSGGSTGPAYYTAINNSAIAYDYDSGVSNVFEKAGTTQTGGGQSHNILQPYEVMAFWKRVS